MPTPKLLVSVRSVHEAHVALDAGVDILDVKEPGRGSLGQPDRSVVQDVVQLAVGRAPVSMALGEWYQQQPAVPEGVQWAKLGLARCVPRHEAYLRWLQMRHRLGVVPLIGVVYADRWRVQGASFERVLQWMIRYSSPVSDRGRTVLPAPAGSVDSATARALPAEPGIQRVPGRRPGTRVLSAEPGTSGVLIDTAIKDGKGLLHWCSLKQLRRWHRQCQLAGLFLALAGSLTLADVKLLAKEVNPEIIAVRGAACVGAVRLGRLDPGRIRSLREALLAGS